MPGKVDALIDSNERLRNSIEGMREDIGGFRADIDNLKHDRDQLERNHSSIADGLSSLRDKTQASISELRNAMDQRFSEEAHSIAGLETQLADHADTVSKMQPQIAALQFSRPQLVRLASFGFAVLTALAWCVEAGVRWAVDRVLSMKFGSG